MVFAAQLNVIPNSKKLIMNCFNHPETKAVGLCKHCNKGLCPECLTDLSDGIACKNKHESQVETLNALISRNEKISKMAPKNIWIMPAFYLFLGVIFIGLGLITDKSLLSFPILMGSGFAFFGVILYSRYRVAYKE